MAHVEKYTRKAYGKILNEAYRVHENETAYKNKVDLTKSYMNYSMENLDKEGFLLKLDTRCAEIMQGRKMQDQTNVICSWVHTVPQELLGDPEKERKYFETCYAFDKARYGAENVMDGIVHYDETTPHMTVPFCPVAKSRKTGKQTISSASVLTRAELKTYHADLEQRLEQVFGIKGLALNGRTKGGYTLEEMKTRTEDKTLRNRHVRWISKKEKELKERECELDARESDQKAREAALEISEENNRAETRRLSEERTALSERELKLNTRETAQEEILKRKATRYRKKIESETKSECDKMKADAQEQANMIIEQAKQVLHQVETFSDEQEKRKKMLRDRLDQLSDDFSFNFDEQGQHDPFNSFLKK